ncbi:LytR/AlgR family response regulator transcription factor [Noviherbaspirillum denitrificans]|uniref:Two-component system response regulator n=1 Tax=Noviherbaspirillum denitrificans TaxID=1968433 RepID=A0A254TH89_9BURK|nr:LytTR family DNA-binding domain-containing protein [Noviherbaspirillum denitrificans]OWW22016.1 two-component system response regulator [Noviherbaspirillum denitrificans]
MIPRLYIVDDEAPARARLKTLLSDIAAECPHQLAGEAGSAQDALDGVARIAPDIVLLDVQMPGMTGIELASRFMQGSAQPAVIFVTAFDEYALKAFEVHALDYLLKPVRAARLAEAIRRAAALRATQGAAIAAASKAVQGARQNFSVQERGRVLLIPVRDVLYLKAELKYVTLRTRTHEYLIEESLTSIEEELGEVFVRVHRKALVARDAIVGVERGTAAVDGEGEGERAQEAWQVILRDIDERLPISRRQWPVVKALVR